MLCGVEFKTSARRIKYAVFTRTRVQEKPQIAAAASILELALQEQPHKVAEHQHAAVTCRVALDASGGGGRGVGHEVQSPVLHAAQHAEQPVFVCFVEVDGRLRVLLMLLLLLLLLKAIHIRILHCCKSCSFSLQATT